MVLAVVLSLARRAAAAAGVLDESTSVVGDWGSSPLGYVPAVFVVPLEASESLRDWAGRGSWGLEAAYRWSLWSGGGELARTILTIRSAISISILSFTRYIRGWNCT